MTRTMIDGINSDAATMARQAGDYQLVAGYVDGLYAWSDAQWNLFPPGIIRVRVAVFSTTSDGHVLDSEPGNATPAQCVDWVLMRRAAGIDPTVYCNQLDPVTGWPAIRAAFQARSVAEPHYWVADYDGAEIIPAGAIAKQYADLTALGQPWDVSVVADYWPGVDPAPINPAPPAPAVRRNDMHADLELDKPVVFTNPGAVLETTSQLLIASDFGDAVVRVALFSLSKATWSPPTDYPVGRVGGAIKVSLPPDTNKVSVTLLSVTPQQGAPFPVEVGLDVFA